MDSRTSVDASAKVAAPSGVYEVGLCVTIENNDSNHEQSKVNVTPYLRNIGFKEDRYQHWWYVHYAVDGVPQNKERVHQILPTNESGIKNIASNGHGYMTKGTWYQWGPTKTFYVDNDGNPKHTVGVYLNCTATTPWHCPALVNGVKQYVTYEFGTALHNPHVDAPEPEGISASHFDQDSRRLCYHWKDVDYEYVAYVTVERIMYTGNTAYTRGNLYIGDTDKLNNSQVHSHLVNEIIPETVTRVEFRMCNVSVSGDTEYSNWVTLDTPANSKVWINVPKVGWKKTIPWVKDENGKWHKATKTYAKDNGTWKRTIM